ncbi:MAG: hypothetical protein HKN25_06720 [Pyrinomonadaceae bacterium]|nr:hypothetical protein [Pyrinomonadaceae bacterium]
MAIKKKKRRKSRFPKNVELPETQEDKDKVQYQDEFQKDFGGRIEELASKLEGKGRNILYGIAALAVLAVLVLIFAAYNKRTDNAAQAALGAAIETSQAEVNDAPLPAGSTQKRFKTEKARAEAAIAQFQTVVENYGSPYQEKAKYFIAVNKMSVDRTAAIKELEELAAPGEKREFFQNSPSPRQRQVTRNSTKRRNITRSLPSWKTRSCRKRPSSLSLPRYMKLKERKRKRSSYILVSPKRRVNLPTPKTSRFP